MEGSYLPNNPSFLQDAWKSLSPIPGFEEPQDLDTPDMEPFANLFACASPYKEYSPYKEAKSIDSNDVYASMRHTLVHPSTQTLDVSQNSLGGQFQTTGLFTHGGSKNLMDPGPPVVSQAHVTLQGVPVSNVTYPQIQVSGATGGNSGHFYSGNDGASAPVFPTAMSVNLSMNMTMGVPNLGEHFVGTATSSVPPNHVQWTVPSGSYNTNGPSAMVSGYGQPVQMPSPTQGGGGTAGTYTITAEFRPAETLTLPSIEKEFPSCNASFKSIPGAFYPHPCKVSVPLETSGSSHMFKSKGRSVPTGLATCFPASATSESPSPTTVIDGVVLQDAEANGVTASKLNLCRICGKTYARPSTLKTHLRTHSGERPYRCGTCHKSFSQAANLTAHIRTHSGEKPFRCHVCDRRFSQSSSVTTHMRTHSGERPYRCYMCKKSFSDSSTLTKHLRIHSGEKPYQCKLCLLRFSQSGNLNRHMRVHAASI